MTDSVVTSSNADYTGYPSCGNGAALIESGTEPSLPSGNVTTIIFSVWDGDWAILEEYTTGNVRVESYVQGYHGLVKTMVSNVYYYQDELGSTSHVASATGALLESYQYDLYGKPRVYNSGGTYQPTATPVAKDLFTGQRWITEIGLYDDRNRFMSPELGRFLQPDPIGFKGDASNLYRYVGNDWANRTDPMGTESCERFIIASTWEQARVKQPFQSERGAIMSAMFGVYRMQIRNQQQDMQGFTMNGSANKRSSFSSEARNAIARGPRLAQAGAQAQRARTITESGNLQLDTDGSGPDHGDPHHANETSYQPHGRSLNADRDRYVAVPTSTLSQGIRMGDRAVLTGNGSSASGVVGDAGSPGWVEASVAFAHGIGLRTRDVPGTGPVPDTPGGREVPVTVTIYPSGQPDQ